jgi:lambda repressor-like predicted transcriptional regulator
VVYDQRLVPDIGAWLTARLGPVQLEAAVSEAAGQAVEASRPIEVVVTEIQPIQTPPPDPHPGGLLDPSRIDLVRRAIRSSGVTAGAVARQAGVSLPTLSNALARRFGLSPAAWDRLQAAAMALDRRQPDIFTPQGRSSA